MIETHGSAIRRKTWLDNETNDLYIRCGQRVTYWSSKLLARLTDSRTTTLLDRSDMTADYSYVFAANHQCRLDPFVISGSVPFSIWRPLKSIRYMIYNRLLDVPGLKQFLLWQGCFPATRHAYYPYGLDYSREQLAAGKNIFIFPEGSRVIRGERAAHNGVAILAREPNVMIIPAHIEWRRRGWWHGFDLTVGKPFDGSKMTAQEILDRIYALPVKRG